MNVLPNGVEHQEQDLEMRENVAHEFEPWIYGDKINLGGIQSFKLKQYHSKLWLLV